MYCPKCNKNYSSHTKKCKICGGSLIQPHMQADSRKQKKAKTKASGKNHRLLIPILIAAAALALILLAILFYLLTQSSSNISKVLYTSGQELLMITEEDGYFSDTIQIADSMEVVPGSIVYEDDGKYAFLLTDSPDGGETGSLVRIAVSKINEDTQNPSSYIREMDDSVVAGSVAAMKKGSAAYLKADGSLYVTNGTKTTQLDENVESLLTGDSEHIYYAKISAASSRTAADGGEILDVYCSDGKNPGKCLAAGVLDLVWGKDAEGKMRLAFLTLSDQTAALYDYVTDSHSEYDAGITEPVEADYQIPVYQYHRIESSTASESDYGILFTTVKESLYWYRSKGYAYSMEDAFHVNWGDDNAAIRQATQDFIDKYSSQANEYGLIEVTEEVKADLKKINAANSERSSGEWIELCMYREQTGTATNNQYQTDLDAYNEIKDRIELRKTLQNTPVSYYCLYVYDGKEVSTVSDMVLNFVIGNNCILYNTNDSDLYQWNLDEGEQILTEAEDMTDFDYQGETLLLTMTGDNTLLGPRADDDLGQLEEEGGPLELECSAGQLFALSEGGTLISGEILKNNIAQTRTLSDNLKEASFYSDGKIAGLSSSGGSGQLLLIDEEGNAADSGITAEAYARLGANCYVLKNESIISIYNGKDNSSITENGSDFAVYYYEN